MVDMMVAWKVASMDIVLVVMMVGAKVALMVVAKVALMVVKKVIHLDDGWVDSLAVWKDN